MRKLMWFAIGFCGACALGAYAYGNWMYWACAAALIAAVLLAVCARRYKLVRVVAAVVFGLSVGLSWFLGYDAFCLSQPRNVKAGNYTIAAQDYSFETSHGCCFDGSLIINDRAYRVRAYLNDWAQIEPGDRVDGEFSFRFTPAGDDNEMTSYPGKGIFLLAFQAGEYQISGGNEPVLWDYPAIWRQTLRQIIEDSFPADTFVFANALLLGDKKGIDYQTNTAFKISGISHIIAVSGLHVSILFSLVYNLTARRRFLAALIGIPTVVAFMAVAGFTPSVVRAGIMQILMMLALLFDRDYDPATALSFAVLTMLAVNPLTITSVSFQLSVSCMAGIFLFSERIRLWLMDKGRFGRWKGRMVFWLCSGVSVTLSAMVFTTPFVAAYFGTVSLIGVVTNLLTLWVVSYIFYGSILVCAVGCLHMGVASALAWVVAWPIRYVLLVAKALSSLPLAAVYTKSIYIVGWLVFCYVLFGVLLLLKKKPVVLFSCAAVLGLCLALGLSWTEPQVYECRVTALDVGQGQCILLQSRGKTFLVDCGGSFDAETADIAAETLLSQGIGRIDGMILTHYDRDHVGAVSYFLTRISTNSLFLPFAQDDEDVAKMLSQKHSEETVSVKDDLILTFADVSLTIFAPVSYKSGNESSMCVLFQTKNCDILITGDRSEQTENILLQHYDLPKLEVLIAGHHGAKSSTGQQLLAATRPEYVFISVGYGNSYGHPAQEVFDRIGKFGCRVLRTDHHGTIVFRR